MGSLRQKINAFEEKYQDYMGYIYGLTANFLYAIYDYKIRDTASVPTFQLLSYRAVANLLMVYLYAKSTNTPLLYKPKQLNQTFVVSGIIMVGSNYLAFYGFQRANLSEAIALYQLIPVITLILGGIFLKEASDCTQSFVTVLSIIGAVLILKPPFIISSNVEASEEDENPERTLGNIALLISATFFAISLLFSRKMAVQKVDPQVGMFYSSIILCMVSALGVMSQGYRSLDGSEIVNVVWICFLSYVAHSFFLKALKYGDAGKVSLTTYAEIPFGYALDVMFLGHVPELLSTLGVFLIFSCLFVQILKNQIFKYFREKFQKRNAKLTNSVEMKEVLLN